MNCERLTPRETVILAMAKAGFRGYYERRRYCWHTASEAEQVDWWTSAAFVLDRPTVTAEQLRAQHQHSAGDGGWRPFRGMRPVYRLRWERALAAMLTARTATIQKASTHHAHPR